MNEPPAATDTPADDVGWYARQKLRLSVLFEEYGPVAIGIYVTFWVLAFFGSAYALSRGSDLGFVRDFAGWFGLSTDGMLAGAGYFGGAYVVLKITQIPRTLLTLALTPPVAGVLRSVGLRKPPTLDA